MQQQTENTQQEAAAPTEEKKTERAGMPLRRLKFETGLVVLFAAMTAMVALVILDLMVVPRSDGAGTLLTNAFEAFKLIAVTVLGYIFASTRANTSDS